jgi:hypothetical protein
MQHHNDRHSNDILTWSEDIFSGKEIQTTNLVDNDR